MKNQYAYRKHHSCKNALINVCDKVYKYIDDNKIVIMIYLDMSNAFPSINHNILIEKLQKAGFKNKDLKLLKSYIIGTTHRTQIGEKFQIKKHLIMVFGKDPVLPVHYLLFILMT